MACIQHASKWQQLLRELAKEAMVMNLMIAMVMMMLIMPISVLIQADDHLPPSQHFLSLPLRVMLYIQNQHVIFAVFENTQNFDEMAFFLYMIFSFFF